MSTFNNIQTGIQHRNIVFTVNEINKAPPTSFTVNEINKAPPTSKKQGIISNLAVPSITQTNQQPIEEKISAGIKGKGKGRIVTDATKKKLSIKLTNHIVTAATRKKMSAIMTGKRKGYKHTKETKEKISASMTGRRKGYYTHTKETKEKISASMQGKGKGRIATAATRKKLSIKLTGRIVTAATRQKMSDAKTKKWNEEWKERRVKYKGPGGSMSEETNTPVDSEVVLIKKEPCSDHNADSDLNVTGSSKLNREINNTLPILQNPADETQGLLFESEGEIALIKVSKWGFLKSYLDGLAQSQIKNIKSKIKKSMCEWITLNEENRMEYKKRLDEIYEIITPIEIGPARGRSAFAKREIKKFEVLGPYAGTLCKNKDLSQAERKQGPRKISEYLFATSSSHRAINGFSSGNVLSLVNTAQLGNFEKIGKNNICVVLFGKNLNFYVANKDIHKGEEFLVNYGPLYASEIKKEPQEMDLNG